MNGNVKCSFGWCDKKAAKSRHIQNLPVCRACYQHAWEQAKDYGVALSSLNFEDISPFKHKIINKQYKCPRLGCKKIILPTATPETRRRIGNEIVCRVCYQAAWELARSRNLEIETVWEQVKKTKKQSHNHSKT